MFSLSVFKHIEHIELFANLKACYESNDLFRGFQRRIKKYFLSQNIIRKSNTFCKVCLGYLCDARMCESFFKPYFDFLIV